MMPPRALLDRLMRRPLLFALCVVAAYAALSGSAPLRRRLSVSSFIMAGDRYVDAGRTASPIAVLKNSDGYDGQFYYRMALAPLSFAPVLDGATFDNPAYRMQRVVYPAIAWAASAGDAAFVPAALFAVNLAGVGAIAALAAALCAAARLSPWTAVAIVLWPGYVVTLTHDTTEIAAAAFLLAAILARVQGRAAAYGVLAAVTMLARETAAPIFTAIVLYDVWTARRDRAALPWAMAGMLAFLPAAAWHEALAWAWRSDVRGASFARNLGVPFRGAIQALARAVTYASPLGPSPARDAAARLVVVSSSASILALCALACARLRPAFRTGGPVAALAAGWAGIAALMSTLVANGPWIDLTAYARAFTECYVMSCLVISGSGWTTRRPRLLAAAGAGMLGAVAILCSWQLPLG